MHDRRIGGKAHTFGNQGALYIRAMTWFDHETESIWSQPIGTAIIGEYEGVRLEMIPAEVVPWKTWRERYPETLILERGGNPFFRSRNVNPFTGSRGAYVVGVALGDVAKAYPFETVADDVVVNDAIGDVPVFVYANPIDRTIKIFVRSVGGQELEFDWVDGEVRDRQTATLWDPNKGLGLEGELAGALLKELPYTTAYSWAWASFYPDSEIYGS